MASAGLVGYRETWRWHPRVLWLASAVGTRFPDASVCPFPLTLAREGPAFRADVICLALNFPSANNSLFHRKDHQRSWLPPDLRPAFVLRALTHIQRFAHK